MKTDSVIELVAEDGVQPQALNASGTTQKSKVKPQAATRYRK